MPVDSLKGLPAFMLLANCRVTRRMLTIKTHASAEAIILLKFQASLWQRSSQANVLFHHPLAGQNLKAPDPNWTLDDFQCEEDVPF